MQFCEEASYCCPAGSFKDPGYAAAFHAMMTEFAETTCSEITLAQKRLLESGQHPALLQPRSVKRRGPYSLPSSRSGSSNAELEEAKRRRQASRNKTLQAYCIANKEPGVKTHSHTGCSRDAFSRLRKHNRQCNDGGHKTTRKVCSTAKNNILKECPTCRNMDKKDKKSPPCAACVKKIQENPPWFLCSVMILPPGRNFSGKEIKRRWTKERRGMLSRIVNGAILAQEYGCPYLVSESLVDYIQEFRGTIFDTRPEEVKEKEKQEMEALRIQSTSPFDLFGGLHQKDKEDEKGGQEDFCKPNPIDKWLKPKGKKIKQITTLPEILSI